MKSVALFFSLLCSSCVVINNQSLSSEEKGAVSLAKQYMVKHGFTNTPPTQDLPVENVEIFDQLNDSDKAILDSRLGTVDKNPICISHKNTDYFVVFKNLKGGCSKVVKIGKSTEPNLMHSCVKEDFLKDCRKVGSE